MERSSSAIVSRLSQEPINMADELFKRGREDATVLCSTVVRLRSLGIGLGEWWGRLLKGGKDRQFAVFRSWRDKNSTRLTYERVAFDRRMAGKVRTVVYPALKVDGRWAKRSGQARSPDT